MSANALQAALHAALSGDAALSALTGPGKVQDRRPVGKDLPRLVFGAWRTEDWSDSTVEGAEHVFEIEVWSEERGRREAVAIAGRIRALLHDAPLDLVGCRLVTLRHLRSRARRERNSRFFVARLEFRAAVET